MLLIYVPPRGTARETRDPRDRTLSVHRRDVIPAAFEGVKMNPPEEGTPAPTTPDYAAVIEELKAANVALAQKVVALEEKSKGYDAKITALSTPAAPAAKEDPEAAKLAAAKSELDKAYEKALADLGIKKD